jgi:hypothetical protein
MKTAQIVQILSYFRAFPEAGYKANITQEKKARLAKGSKRRLGFVYFVGRPGGGKLPLGVWQRVGFSQGSAVRPILIFVNGANYPVRFDFQYVAQQTIAKEFPAQMQAALAEYAQ